MGSPSFLASRPWESRGSPTVALPPREVVVVIVVIVIVVVVWKNAVRAPGKSARGSTNQKRPFESFFPLADTSTFVVVVVGVVVVVTVIVVVVMVAVVVVVIAVPLSFPAHGGMNPLVFLVPSSGQFAGIPLSFWVQRWAPYWESACTRMAICPYRRRSSSSSGSSSSSSSSSSRSRSRSRSSSTVGRNSKPNGKPTK